MIELLREIAAWLSDPANWQGRFGLPRLVWQHLGYSAGGTIAATLIALPLGLWVGHRRKGELLVVSIANVGRAVPDFGIILIVFLLVGLNVLPILVALAALAIPPILVNASVGIRQVDRDVVEAAEGMGMTGWQVLTRVEIPVAVPLVMAGIRTAAVQVVATATLAAFVGLGGLGRPIIDGYYAGFAAARARVTIAAVLVALLAVATEYSLAAAERGLTPRGLRQVAGNQPLREEAT